MTTTPKMISIDIGETHNAHWRGGGPGDGEYVVSPQGWYSADGDNWVDDSGRPVQTEEFHAATVVLSGGPRDGEYVA